jgi:murein DD-endopeptidase MepM/ murein hydrolase activator NlpD
MSESAVPGQAPLTRRQIREAERSREVAEAAAREREAAERARQAASPTTAPAATAPHQATGPQRRRLRQTAPSAATAPEAPAAPEPVAAPLTARVAMAEHPAAAAPAAAIPATKEAPAPARPTTPEPPVAENRVVLPSETADVPPAAPGPARITRASLRASAPQFPAERPALAAVAAPTRTAPTEAPAAEPAPPESDATVQAAIATAAATPAVAVAHDSDAVDTEVLGTARTLPSRRALRHTSRTPARTAPAHHRAWAPRAAVLGAMGVLTIVAPLTGFAAPDAETAVAAAVDPQRSVLDVLDSQAATAAIAAAPASLLKDPAASSRATVLQTSRAADRDALTCAPLDGASGARAAVTERAEQFVRPVAEGTYRSSSHYGNRSHPLSGAYSFHTGTDYAAPLGTPIYAIADGTVEYVGAGKDGRSSMLVIIRHEIDGQTVYSWHVHMYRDGIHVTEGQQVSAGDLIAEVGNNGNSTGPHLHFEIHLDDQGTTTDPLPWLEKLGAVEVAALC